MHVNRGVWIYLFFVAIGCIAIVSEAVLRTPVELGIPGMLGLVISWQTYIELAVAGVAFFIFLAWSHAENEA